MYKILGAQPLSSLNLNDCLDPVTLWIDAPQALDLLLPLQQADIT